jgi:phenylalanyl-tRNA synthetase beta chain
MKVSVEWLREYVDLPDCPDELVDVLPMLGIEVEEDEKDSGPQLDNVVVGEVLSKNPHPEADRLSVCTVEVGSDEPATIVCGATNFSPGDRVPVALPGAKLPGGFKIKKSKLRGVASEGMMCSAKELELGDDESGLFLLPDSPEIGTPVDRLFIKDKTLELEVTANRGDCLSHIGVARELAAHYEKELKIPEVSIDTGEVDKPSGDGLIDQLTLETENCPFYKLYSIKGIKIGPSPDWLKRRLESVGLRAINNVVDVTNFVLLETGQPLHAFDASKIKGRTIRVRQAEENEQITTLDDVKRTLDPEMMVIADAERALVVAGVMGSVDAEVDDSTVDVVLESAWFQPGNVRATSRRLGLHSDSSQRFSRNVDPEGLSYAAERAVSLILEIAGGELIPECVCVGSSPRGERSVDIEKSFVEKICGFEVDAKEVAHSWERLGFTVLGNDPWTVTIPSFRWEVERPIDLVEEFLRIHGTGGLTDSDISSPALLRENDPSYDFCNRAIDNLVGQGFQETCNYSLRSSEETASWLPQLECENIALANPLTSDHTHVRPSLLPGLADVLAHNQKNLNDLQGVFETGRVFRPGPRGNLECISVAFATLAQPDARQWKKGESIDFFAIKAMLAKLMAATGLSLPKGTWDALENESPWQDGYSATIGDCHRNKLQVTIGIIRLSLSKQKEVRGPIFAGELLIDPVFLAKRKKPVSFQPFSSFPPAIKDLALVVDRAEPAEAVRLAIEEVALKVGSGAFEVDPVSIFDLFEGQGMPEGKKSVACSMRLRAPDRTLSEKEVNQAFDSIVEKIQTQTPYELRK